MGCTIVISIRVEKDSILCLQGRDRECSLVAIVRNTHIVSKHVSHAKPITIVSVCANVF